MPIEDDELDEDYGQEPWGAEFDAQKAWTEIKSLRKENAAARIENKALRADALTEDQQQILSEYQILRDASQTDAERLQAQLEAAQEAAGQVPTLAAENLRLKVAMEKNVPAALAARLQGGTREELEKDADSLLSMVTMPQGMRPNPAQGTSGGGGPGIEDQIAQARKDGNTKLAIRLEAQKLINLPKP